MTARVFHVSDLHAGRRETPGPIEALRELARELRPELLLATGDLAHRGRRTQLERAAELLGSLGLPLLAVPGNHDIPYTFPARLRTPFAEWERVFGPAEPVYSSDSLFVAGLNSVQPWRHQQGALRAEALTRLASRLQAAPARTLRIAALHHHLAAPPWRAAHKRPLCDRDGALEALAAAGVELVASGHVHQAAIAERREFEALDGSSQRSLVLVNVPGLGRPRPRRRGEALGFNVYEADEWTLTIVTFSWDGSTFGEVGRRSFARVYSVRR